MAEIRTLVTFESLAFNMTERREYFINDCCYGDDVARALMEQLSARGIQTDVEPGQEDFGWYFGFHAGGTDYHFVLGLRPAYGSDPAVWIGEVERKVGLVGSLFGARKRGIEPDGLTTIHSAISALPQVTSIRWHRKEDFENSQRSLDKVTQWPNKSPEPTAVGACSTAIANCVASRRRLSFLR